MLLDQQIPMEKAFTSPEVLRERLGGTLDAHTIAGYDPDELEAIFRTPPALHRFPAAMAKRVQSLAAVLVERYDGGADAVWDGARSGDELVGADRRPARLRRAEGEDLRRPAGQAVRRAAATAGARPPATTARRGRCARSPTSSTPTR